MKYKNPRIPEGINVSPGSSLKEFAILSSKAAAALLVLAVVAVLLGGFLGRHMPFSWEKALADATLDLPVDDAEVERALQDLTDRVAAGMDLPAGMTITVHYVDRPVVNAAATIGGNIIVYRGLLSRLPNENALTMLLGHEIAHVRNRDVTANVGSVGLATLVAVAISGQSSGLVEGIANGTNLLVLMQFSRDAERAADRDGLLALIGLYGHINGAEDLYNVLAGTLSAGELRIPEILRSHPLTDDRTDSIAAFASERGFVRVGPLAALSPGLRVPLP